MFLHEHFHLHAYNFTLFLLHWYTEPNETAGVKRAAYSTATRVPPIPFTSSTSVATYDSSTAMAATTASSCKYIYELPHILWDWYSFTLGNF